MHIMIPGSNPQAQSLRVLVSATLLGVCLFVTTTRVRAETFCVTTAQELQDALSAASDGGMYSGETNDIDVVQGTYLSSGAASGTFQYANSGGVHLHLFGGYNNDCSIRSLNASLTVLDGSNHSQVLSLEGAGEIDVSGFTIQNGHASSTAGGGISLNDNNASGSVELFGNIIRNNYSGIDGGGFLVESSGSDSNIGINSNVFYGNSSGDGGGAGLVFCAAAGTDIYNNTVTQNTTTLSGGTGGIILSCANGSEDLTNNILMDNTNAGIEFQSNSGVSISFDYNDYGSIAGTMPTEMNGNVSVSPLFVNAAHNDFHLAGDSPLLGASPILIRTTDPDGNSAPAGGAVDIGAYNETIFVNGFEK